MKFTETTIDRLCDLVKALKALVKQLGYFLLIVAAVIAMTSVIYWALYDYWPNFWSAK